LQDLVTIPIQRIHSEAQRREDSCEVKHPGIFLSGGLPDPLDVGNSLDDKLVGEDNTENGQVGTPASEEERRATTLFEEGLNLRTTLMKVGKCVRTTNLIRDKRLSDIKRSLWRRITPPRQTQMYTQW